MNKTINYEDIPPSEFLGLWDGGTDRHFEDLHEALEYYWDDHACDDESLPDGEECKNDHPDHTGCPSTFMLCEPMRGNYSAQDVADGWCESFADDLSSDFDDMESDCSAGPELVAAVSKWLDDSLTGWQSSANVQIAVDWSVHYKSVNS